MSDVNTVWLTKQELADRWQVTTRTIENMVASGECPAPWKPTYKVARWDLAKIVAYENEHPEITA